MDWILSSGMIVFGLVVIGIILARLYQRATKERAFVRTGKGGQKVVKDGGALVIPVLHDTIPVNMTTVRIDVTRAAEDALITKDRMRVDVRAEFYLRVAPKEDAIATAAQTLGRKTLNPAELSGLVTGKFVDALRSVAAGMDMEDLHEQRAKFVQMVQNTLASELGKNGLELESVSLTGLDQTDKKFFNPDNAFDAQGLLKLTEQVERRRKERNEVERGTEVAIQRRDLEAEQESLQLGREAEYARMAQEREISERRAEQKAMIAKWEAEKAREAKEANILAARQLKEAEIAANVTVDQKKISTEQSVEQARILKDQALKTARIEEQRAVETATISKSQAIEMAEQDRQITLANKSQELSEAKKLADTTRAQAVMAEEAVVTARLTAEADRAKQVELIEASKAAERQAIQVTVAAEAEKRASEDKAEAQRLIARGQGDAVRIQAEADKDAAMARAEAKSEMYRVDAEGRMAQFAAENSMGAELLAFKLQQGLIGALPNIIRESVRPMEKIDSIKIIQAEGLIQNGPSGEGGTASDGDGSDMVGKITNSALRYQAQAPLLNALMAQVGLPIQGTTLFPGVFSASSRPAEENRRPTVPPPPRKPA
jgi:uncharacterized membrane protein YqiK